MLLRVSFVVLICLGFCAATVASAQQPDQSGLDRRLAELEKQLGQMLKEVKELRKGLPAAPQEAAAPQIEIKLFSLRNANAADMTRILQDLFQGRDGRTMSIGADLRTNSVIVRSRSDLLQAIEAVIARLDEGRAQEKSKEPVKKSSRPAEDRRKALTRRVAEAESELAMRKERLAWSYRLFKQGYLSESQARAEAVRLDAAEVALERAKAELEELRADPQDCSKKEDSKK